MRGSISSPMRCIMAAPCSRASASMTARSSSSPSIANVYTSRPKGSISKFPIPWRKSTHACRDVVRANKLVDGYVRPIAWRGSEQMGVSAQATKINLAIAAWDWGSYFDPAARTKGLRLTIGHYRQAGPAHRPGQEQGGGLYMICTIEKHRAEKAGLCRCADARLARADRRGHRRQYLLRQGRRAAYADFPIASSTASPAAR